MAPILLIPRKADEERDRVAEAWPGPVERLDRFWQPPPVDRDRVRLYGNDVFCLVLAELLGVELVSPPDDLLLRLPPAALGRDVGRVALADAGSLMYPRFAKPLVPKQFAAAVYTDAEALNTAAAGLPPETEVVHSAPVAFAAEARAFVLDGRVAARGLYAGTGDLEAVDVVVEAVATDVAVPDTFVLDVGLLDGRWVVVEANATWGAGLNGCDPAAVVPCVAAATRAR